MRMSVKLAKKNFVQFVNKVTFMVVRLCRIVGGDDLTGALHVL